MQQRYWWYRRDERQIISGYTRIDRCPRSSNTMSRYPYYASQQDNQKIERCKSWPWIVSSVGQDKMATTAGPKRPDVVNRPCSVFLSLLFRRVLPLIRFHALWNFYSIRYELRYFSCRGWILDSPFLFFFFFFFAYFCSEACNGEWLNYEHRKIALCIDGDTFRDL